MPVFSKSIRFIFVALLVLSINACSGGDKFTKANKAYLIGEYDRAVKQFKKAYKKEKSRYSKGEISFYIGDCYRQLDQPKKATVYFARSVRYNYEDVNAELYLADAYLAAQKYEEAQESYESFLDKKPLDRRGQNGLASVKLAVNDTIVNRYSVEMVKALSSARYSDFSPAYGNADYDQVYFSSMRTEKKSRRRNRITGQGSCNIYLTRIDAKGKWTEPEALDAAINTTYDEGAGNMSSDGKTMYFTKCRYDNEQPLSAEIYEVSRSGGKWGEPNMLPLGGDSLMVAHPSVSPDGNMIYFVSDMPGGLGGKDIWRVEKEGDGNWGQPQNMGSVINTPGDEMFPYVREDETLYFSSNAHVGYGGLDIYRAVFNEEKGIYEVHNLGRPINSEVDDFGITFKGMNEEGLLSSSRGSARGVDNIYHFILPKLEFSMKGKVFNQEDDEPLSNAYVKIVGSDGTNLKLNVTKDGSFGSKLKSQTDYVFMVGNVGYFNYKKKFTTTGLSDNKEFEFDVPMLAMDNVVEYRNIYFDENQSTLTKNAQEELDRLSAILSINPTVKLNISAFASGEGNSRIESQLSEDRADEVLNYLVKKGVKKSRLTAKGFGATEPITVDARLAEKYHFLNEGVLLTEGNISRIRGKDNQAMAHSLNRRVEFTLVEEMKE